MTGRKRIMGNRWTAMTAIAILALVARGADADWTVTPRGSVSLNEGGVTGIQEFSGVTYMGPAAGGLERFAAIQDSGNQLVTFDVSFSGNGTLNSAQAISARSLAPGSDDEGIVFTGRTRNTVFVSEETTPGVHEHNLATGARLQTVTLSSVFGTRRSNRGFESLTRSLSGGVMWTANEEALTIDGPTSTPALGTIVRLQRMLDDGAKTTAGPQYAYRVEPVHAGGTSPASGLVDLVMLPDDTLLSLERSANTSLPPFRSSIHKIRFDGATDISGPEFDSGLASAAFNPVFKTELWSGQIGGAAGVGANVEGLTLGPALGNGRWLLLGVVDNGGSGATAVVSFELALAGAVAAGDYNRDGSVNKADYMLWKNTFGSTIALSADGNGNNVIDSADYTVWRNSTSDMDGAEAKAAVDRSASAPEPTTAVLGILAMIVLATWR
jgi:hypothetical protein